MSISAIILAGGRATRMDGVDKGLVNLQGIPLIQHVINRIRPQVDEILINANRETARYQSFGYPVLADELSDFPGPLAGLSLGLTHAKYEYLLAIPCDSPLLPINLVSGLMAQLINTNADIAVASSHDKIHPVFCLCKKNVLPSLNHYLAQGERRVSAWQKKQAYTEVVFNDDTAFINLNTLEDVASLEAMLNN
jgi:molybdopterin-guanine dinucleotide biosynthesis protein A